MKIREIIDKILWLPVAILGAIVICIMMMFDKKDPSNPYDYPG